MGHYSESYERDEDRWQKERERDREKLVGRVRQDLATQPLEEILVKIIKGEYK